LVDLIYLDVPFMSGKNKIRRGNILKCQCTHYRMSPGIFFHCLCTGYRKVLKIVTLFLPVKYKGENFWRQEFLTCCWNSSSMSLAVPPVISILLSVFLSMFDYYYDVPAARFTGQVLFAIPQWLVCVNLPFPLSHIHSFTPIYSI
jgi:hypothetical protein